MGYCKESRMLNCWNNNVLGTAVVNITVRDTTRRTSQVIALQVQANQPEKQQEKGEKRMRALFCCFVSISSPFSSFLSMESMQ